MKNFVNNIAEKYDLNPDITHAFVEHMRYVEVDKNSHIIEKGGFTTAAVCRPYPFKR